MSPIEGPFAASGGDAIAGGTDATALLRRLIDLLPHQVFVRDAEGRFLLANRALAARFGATPDAVEGRTEGELRAALADAHGAPVPAESPAPALEEAFVDAAGEERFLSTVRVAFESTAGRAELGVSIDITDRKRAREKERRLAQAVEAAARDWRDTFDSIRAAVLVIDLEGVVVRANRVAAEWLQVGVSTLPGRRWTDLARAEPWRRAAQLVEAVSTGGRGAGTEVRDEGSAIAWEIRVDPALHRGAGTVIVLIRDVTEMVEVREWARRNESLAALGSVVAGVAHEVRNPMAAISAHVEALALQNGALGADESIVALRAEVKRLSQLVTELLEYGRPRPSDFETLSLAEVLRSALDASGPSAAAAGVRLETPPFPSLPTVLGDPGRLRRVFVNLIENAIQHSPAGGTVTVTARATRDSRGVECRVTDAGRGFAAGDLARAFEPFFTRRRGGTGLGLPIVRRILSDHGGTVEVGNRPEGGAYVLVSLPARAGA